MKEFTMTARLIAAFLLALAMVPAAAADPVEDIMIGPVGDGSLDARVAVMQKRLELDPGDDTARFGLGILQFLRSGELLAQSAYRYGMRTNELGMMTGALMGPLNVPLGINPDPEMVREADVRAVLEQWLERVAAAERTLAKIDDEDVKLPLRVGLLRMDFNGDGKLAEKDALWQRWRAMRLRFQPDQASANEFVIAFDRGDVSWLRGYCHICLAVGEMILAHDTSGIFDTVGHLLFERPDAPCARLRESGPVDVWDERHILDMIAFIHMIRLPVQSPDGLRRAHAHLQQAVAMSRDMWMHYDREMDDDREWVPNTKQLDAALPGATVDAEIRATWLQFLDEAEKVLDGERLLRFWRGAREQGEGAERTEGVNLNRAFMEPRTFDLVLWVQGSAALPYLEEGELTSPGLWRRMRGATRGRAFRYMWWFN
jgi:hypothetical protein